MNTKLVLSMILLGMILLTACDSNISGEARRTLEGDGEMALPEPQVIQKPSPTDVIIKKITVINDPVIEPGNIISHGKPYLIEGQGFGKKVPVEPMMYDTLDNQEGYAGLVHGEIIPTGAGYNWGSMCSYGNCTPL